MATTLRPSATPAADAVDPTRRTAYVVGILFVITFIASIPAQFYFYAPLLNHPTAYVLGPGEDLRVSFGAFLEVITIIANLGCGVALFTLLRRQHEGLALGYVVARIMESGLMAIGVVSLLSVVTLRQNPGHASAAMLSTASRSLVAVHDWTFLLGPGFTVGIGNGLILGYLMYTTHLVPRRMAMLGLIGGPLILLSGTAVLLGAWDQVSAPSAIATIPEFFWELSFGIYLIVKGFRPEASARLTTPAVLAGAAPLPA